MRAFSSGLPKTFILAAAYLAVHLPFLAPSLEDVDSINFALGLRDFNPALHQPHPPGHPVYIALGRLSLAVVSWLWPSMPPIESAALALAFWSAIGGAAAILGAVFLFAALEQWSAAGDASAAAVLPPWWRRERLLAAVLVAVMPLVWITALRPMSDVPGLAIALFGQGLAVAGLKNRRALIAAALVAGLAAGLRVQTFALTAPLLLLACVAQRQAGIVWLFSRPLAALAAGVLAWLVPLVVASGGFDAYLAALGTQADEDFSWATMLWADRTPRRLAFVLYETFVLPWGSLPLAIVVLCLAGAGIVVAARRARAALLLVAAGFVPYAIFHMLFHETIMLRYAVPVVPAVVWLAVQGLSITRAAAPLVAGAVMVAALGVGLPTAVLYGLERHPVFRLIDDASASAGAGVPEAVFAHHEIWRPLQAESGGLPVVAPRRQFEWLGLVDYWRSGHSGEVWFFADARRTDLDLVDPVSRRVASYRWTIAGRPEVAGIRPMAVDWYRFLPPGWFVGEGWSLTPEAGGLTAAMRSGPGLRPIHAWIRRRGGALHLLIGGRHLGPAGAAAAEFELAIDGVVRDRWTLRQEDLNFLRFVELPEGLPGDGAYATATITATSPGGPPPDVAIRQFDAQDVDRILVGFGEGWHEEEFELQTGRRWRWTSERSVLRLEGPARTVRVSFRGESPLRYFDAPPRLRVIAGGRTIAELRPDDDFEWTVTVPAADVERAAGAIAIESDRVYLPGEVEGTSDARRLGVRLWETRVSTASP